MYPKKLFYVELLEDGLKRTLRVGIGSLELEARYRVGFGWYLISVLVVAVGGVTQLANLLRSFWA